MTLSKLGFSIREKTTIMKTHKQQNTRRKQRTPGLFAMCSCLGVLWLPAPSVGATWTYIICHQILFLLKALPSLCHSLLCPKYMQDTCIDLPLKSRAQALTESTKTWREMKVCEFAFKKSYQNSQAIHWELCWRGTLEKLSSKIKVYVAMYLSYHFNNLLYPAKCLVIQPTAAGWNGMFSQHIWGRPRRIGSHGYSSLSTIL